MVGMVFDEVVLRNDWDVGAADRGLIKESEIRQLTVSVVVDTGAATLVINETVQQELGLRTMGRHESTLANGEKIGCMIAETVEGRWRRRFMTCQPWVVPGAKQILLGAIPLENMDLIVDPANQKLVGAHGDEPMGIIY